MKKKNVLFLFCFALCMTASAPAFAERLLDVIEAAQTAIQKKFPNRDSLARKMGLEELEQLARSGQPDEEIIKAVLEKFPETSAELFARSDLNSNSVPDEWEMKFKVSPGFTAPESDEDADGFTLLQEYKAGTDPVDPLSHPKYVTQLFVCSINQKRITGLELISVDGVSVGGDPLVTFNTIQGGRKKSEVVRINSSFTHNNERFIVDGLDRRCEVVYVRHVGMSERIPCRLRQPVYLPTPRVRLLNSVNAAVSVLPVGATFKLGSKRTGEEIYRIVSADPEAKLAVVESVGETPGTFAIQPVPHDVLVAATAAKTVPEKKDGAAAAPANPAASANPAAPLAFRISGTLSQIPNAASAPARTARPVKNAAPKSDAPAKKTGPVVAPGSPASAKRPDSGNNGRPSGASAKRTDAGASAAARGKNAVLRTGASQSASQKRSRRK